MHINEMQMKIIAIGLVPVFLILTFALPKTASTAILLGVVMITVGMFHSNVNAET